MSVSKQEYKRRKAAGECVICQKPARTTQRGTLGARCERCNAIVKTSNAKYESKRPPRRTVASIKTRNCALMSPPRMLLTFQREAEKQGLAQHWEQIVAEAYRLYYRSLNAQDTLPFEQRTAALSLLADAFHTALAEVRSQVCASPVAVVEETRSYEPFRRYTQYVSPVNGAL